MSTDLLAESDRKGHKSLLLSNLRSERSQERYKQGKIVIEAEDVTESETQSTEEQYADDQEIAYSYSFISGETDDDCEDEADSDEDESDDSLSEPDLSEGQEPDSTESEASENFEDAIEIFGSRFR